MFISNYTNQELIEAEIIKFQTTKDGAFRITLDICSSNKNLGHYLADKAVDAKCIEFIIIDGEHNG